MKSFFKDIDVRYKAHFSDRAFVASFVWSLVLLIAALVAHHYGAVYAIERASNPVTDIVLSNIPAFDVDWLFVFGPLIFWFIIILFLLQNPARLPFTLKTLALFILIRTVFVSLTHLAPFPHQVAFEGLASSFMQIFTLGSDLFFSGHTGAPFLMALVLWRYRVMRVFCICSSIFFGVIVLLGHMHYSIDVASAFFITYSIFHLAEFLFKKDHERFMALFTTI